jgi:hypothetical protein
MKWSYYKGKIKRKENDMNYICSSTVLGDRKGDIHRLFGNVYLGDLNHSHVKLKLVTVLPNVYRASNAGEDKSALLYVVAPIAGTIGKVWPGRREDVVEVKFGTATDDMGNIITQAIAIDGKELATLYLCLSPNGICVDETSSLGI